MSYDTALIECVKNPKEIFTNSKKGDIVFYPLNKSQKILLGSEINKEPCITIDNNKLGIFVDKPKSPLHINGKTKMDGDLEINGKYLRLLNTDFEIFNQNSCHGALSTNKKYHGIFFHQLSDKNKLDVKTSMSPKEAIEIIKNIPVHNLQEKTKDTQELSEHLESLGCLAEELTNVYPPCVSNIHDVKTVDYTKLIPILIQSIKHLNEKIENLQK